jgi:protein MpaA
MRVVAVVVFVFVALVASGMADAKGADPSGKRVLVLGRSIGGREIVAVETGDLDSRRRTLIVGCVHGNESAGIAVAKRLADGPPPNELDLWVVPNLNPDGTAAGTRGNGRGVDLNRNFPWRWRPLDGPYYSGPRPLSEPESRIAYYLIRRVAPAVSIWFHQHLNVVDESGGNVTVERRFAELSGLRLARLPREPGSAVGWTNHEDPRGAAFVVELPSGALSQAAVTRFAHAVIAVSGKESAPSG